MKNGNRFFGTLIAAGILLAGCGDGGDSKNPADDTSPGKEIAGNDPGSGSGTADLIVEPNCSMGPIKLPDGASFQTQFGADGDFRATCLTLASNPQGANIKLANGIPSMNVVDVERVMEFDDSCSDGEVSRITHSSNYKTGVVTLSGSLNGQPMSCTEQYIAQLPVTISTSESIHDLLFNWGTDDERTGLISSTCPDYAEETDDVVTCTGYSLYNITVTDDRGNKHRVAGKVEFTDL